MPLYEYRCRSCDSVFEELVRNGRNGQAVACPECGQEEPERLMSASAGRVAEGRLPVTSSCPPSDAPPCSPHCCRLP